MNGHSLWSTGRAARRRLSVLVASCAIATLGAACGDAGSAVSPTSPAIASTEHAVPNGFHVESFDALTCDTPTNTFVSGTVVCGKPAGLGNGFSGTLEWINPSAVVVRTTTITNVNGNVKDYYTPLACGTWTLRVTHDAGEVRTGTFTVTDCVQTVQGCSPGFWRQEKHFGDWPSPPAPSDLFQAIFARLITVNQPGQNPDVNDPTLLQALWATSDGVNRAARIGTAAYLSALHSDVAYPYTSAQVVQAVKDAIDGASGAISIDDLENVWKDVVDHCPLGDDSGDSPS